MFNFFILSSVWNTRFRVFSDHTDYPRELKLIGTERIMGYHHVSWLSISVKPKNMKETTLVLRVCVYMTARSWTNVWHTTYTKYTQMSVLQCGGCLTIFICQLCGNIIWLYFNCDYTQPVWEQISNTNQFIQNVQPTGGRTVPTYPLRVYSEIPMTRIARSQRNADRSHSLVVIYHNNPQESENALCQHASRCV
jgi:hypothetical protein